VLHDLQASVQKIENRRVAHASPRLEGVEKSETCHAERSEASLQFFVSDSNKSNCGDPSPRSESVTFFNFAQEWR
jgi:hypothetical protein